MPKPSTPTDPYPGRWYLWAVPGTHSALPDRLAVTDCPTCRTLVTDEDTHLAQYP